MTRFVAIPMALAIASVLVVTPRAAQADTPAPSPVSVTAPAETAAAKAPDDAAAKAALVRSLAGAEGTAGGPTVSTRAGTVEPMRPNRLAEVGSSRGAAATNAGTGRDVAVKADAAASVARPVAGARMVRRMNVDRALAGVASGLQACADTSGLPAPATPTFKLTILPSGEVERTAPGSTAGVARDTMACVAVVLATAKFTGPGGAGASLEVPVTLKPSKVATASAPAPAGPAAAPEAPSKQVVASATH